MIHAVELVSTLHFIRREVKILIHRMRHESDLNDLEEAFGEREYE